MEDPKRPESRFFYDTGEVLVDTMRALIARLRTAEGGRSVAAEVRPFVSTKYYYMFEEGGQGLADYSAYILGDEAGIARGLNPDFGRVELVIDGQVHATFHPHERL